MIIAIAIAIKMAIVVELVLKTALMPQSGINDCGARTQLVSTRRLLVVHSGYRAVHQLVHQI